MFEDTNGSQNIYENSSGESTPELSDDFKPGDPNFDDQHYALRHGVGIRDISFLQILEITGNDALEFLHRISTNSVKNLEVNKKINTLFTNEKGRVIDRATIIKLVDKIIIAGNWDERSKLKKWIERYIVNEDINVKAANDKYFLIEVLGPQSESYLMQFLGSSIISIHDNVADYNSDDLNLKIIRNDNLAVSVRFWILGEKIAKDSVYNYLMSFNNIFEPVRISEPVYETFRIEEGIPSAAFEIIDDYNPHEINLIDEVDFNKGCYIGQEVIARLATYDKVQKKLRGIILENPTDLSVPIRIQTDNDEDAGIITSISNSKLIGSQIGLALIKRNYSSKNQKLFFMNNSHKINITIVDLPFKK